MCNMNIYMTGVGGQGIGVLAEVMIQACLAAGLNVKGVDTHGLAQRGGIVVSHLRIGERLFTPRIAEHSADVVIALERLEAYRGTVNYLATGGTLVYYDTEMQPIHVRMGKAGYPGNELIEIAVKKRRGRLARIHLDDLPDPRMQNTALLGKVAGMGLIDGVTTGHFLDALRMVVPGGALEANENVFNRALSS